MEKDFTVCCTMEERWIPTFLQMLKSMEYCGHIGHSEYVGLFSDGDGGFRPRFTFDKTAKEHETNDFLTVKNPSGQMTMFDAG